MKRLVTLFAALNLCTVFVKSQQIPLYSQIYFMRMLYNPALTAYNGGSNLFGFYRAQWTAMPGHPVTGGTVADISLWKDRIGTGIHIYSDNTDVIHRINAQLYYAQKVRFAKDHVLSLGISLGIMQTRVDFSNVVANDLDDPNLLFATKSGVAFDMNAGFAYQWKKLTLTFSVPQVLNTTARITSQLKENRYSMKRHFVAGASYEISIKKETYNIEPSVLVKKGASQPVQVDANIMANYKRMIFLGVSYRLDYGVTMMAAVRIAKCVTIGYGFDYPIQKGLDFSSTGATHEVMMGITFDKWLKPDNKNPRDMPVKKSEYDSLLSKVTSIQDRLDTIQKSVDSLERLNMEHQQRLDQLQHNVDSMEIIVKKYKKQTSDHPVIDFPANVDENTKASIGDVLRLSTVNFQRNSSYFDASSFPELDRLAFFLKNNPDMKVRIVGHTDFKASDEYNDWLSNNRAKRLYDYLVVRGIETSRMSYIGMGKRAPIADNATEDGQAKNRRVEIEVTSTGK